MHMTTITRPLSERDQRIQAAQLRAAEILTARPDKARSTNATTCVVGEGLACRIKQGDNDLLADLGPGMGGDALAPSPSFLARAAIGSCVAIAIKMLAATRGLTFDAVHVTVETDFDDRGLFGIAGSPAPPLATHISIAIDTDATEAQAAAIVETALARDPWFLALRDPQTVTTAVTVEPPQTTFR